MTKPQVDLTSQLSSSNAATEAFNKLLKELKAKEDEVLAEEANDVKIATMVLSVVSKIPKPKDGRDGVDGIDGINGIDGIDGKQGPRGLTGPKGATGANGKDGLNGVAGIDGKDGADGANGEKGDKGDKGDAGKDGIIGRDGIDGKDGEQGPKGDKGDTGPKGADGRDGINGRDGVNGKDGLQGKTGKQGPKGDQGVQGTTGKTGVKGKDGRNGTDGVGIKDIKAYGSSLNIKLTDGTIRDIHLPMTQPGNAPVPETFQRAVNVPYNDTASNIGTDNVQGALDSLVKYRDTVLVETVTSSYTAKALSATILADCSMSDVTIELPNPELCYYAGRSYRIVITRIDTGFNKLFISPHGLEKVLLQPNVEMFGGEVINLITNGIDWYLGA